MLSRGAGCFVEGAVFRRELLGVVTAQDGESDIQVGSTGGVIVGLFGGAIGWQVVEFDVVAFPH